MGGIATRLCDQVWVTSDNPRSERPGAIIDEIVAGIRDTRAAAERYITEPDRGSAIRAALAWGRRGDTVVIAGKGHETYQIVGSDVLSFDDREVARSVLSQLHGGLGGRPEPPNFR
jgi:UDP-N-acetylmuramoyl-L-alanyl-D-glutamate--2,6-diaminopimelate ligase